jgi:hypothetical protein
MSVHDHPVMLLVSVVSKQSATSVTRMALPMPGSIVNGMLPHAVLGWLYWVHMSTLS